MGRLFSRRATLPDAIVKRLARGPVRAASSSTENRRPPGSPLLLSGICPLRGLRGILLTLAVASALTGWTRAQEPEPGDDPPSAASPAAPAEAPSAPDETKPASEEDEHAPKPKPEPESAPSPQPAQTPLVYLFLNAPTDLNDLISMLSKPDFVLVEWARYQALQAQAEAAKKAGEPDSDVISSVEVRGVLDHERANLEVEYQIITVGDGPHRVALGLDGEVVGSATEQDRPIRLEAGPQGGWVADLEGRGEHRVLLRLHPPVRSTSEGSQLNLTIPRAASTKLDLRTQPSVIEARLGTEESIPVVPAPEGEGSVLRAYVSPRSRLDLSWRTRSVEGPSGPALLTAQGEIAIEVQRGLLQARATYEIRAERGTARTIGIKLDPEDELLALEIDGKSAGIEPAEDRPGAPLTITLPDPVRPDEPRKVLVAVRRPLSGTGPAPVTFRGFPLVGVAAQSGLIAVSQSGDLWISGTPGRSLRQVDPRSDLPPSLRVQPSYVLAYQFLDQPFELALQVDPSPPWVRVDAKTTMSLANGESKIDQRLEYRISRGRLFQLRIAMPPGLDLDSVGPDSVVESAEVVPSSLDDDTRAGKTLILPLTQSARESATFTLRLVGRQKIDASGSVEAGLFRPLDASWRGGSVAVLAARNLSVDLGPTRRLALEHRNPLHVALAQRPPLGSHHAHALAPARRRRRVDSPEARDARTGLRAQFDTRRDRRPPPNRLPARCRRPRPVRHRRQARTGRPPALDKWELDGVDLAPGAPGCARKWRDPLPADPGPRPGRPVPAQVPGSSGTRPRERGTSPEPPDPGADSPARRHHGARHHPCVGRPRNRDRARQRRLAVASTRGNLLGEPRRLAPRPVDPDGDARREPPPASRSAPSRWLPCPRRSPRASGFAPTWAPTARSGRPPGTASKSTKPRSPSPCPKARNGFGPGPATTQSPRSRSARKPPATGSGSRRRSLSAPSC